MTNLSDYVSKIEDIDTSIEPRARKHLDNLTKPRGSLGKLEDFAARVVCIQEKIPPHINRKIIFTIAGDHGVCEEGVSAFPSEVTQQMVYNFLDSGAAVNVLARHAGAEVVVVDAGVNAEFDDAPGLKVKKVRKGTSNMVKGPAMSIAEAELSILNGIESFTEEHKKTPIDIVGVGDMGIGNTTPSTAIIAAVSGKSVDELTGRGTGIDDEGLERKKKIIQKSLEINNPNPDDGLDILSKVGGFEIGSIAGVVLAAAANKVPVVIDGLISTAGALIAYKICPKIQGYVFSSHRSVEIAHATALKIMGLEPILDLNMRLGEGTGSCLAIQMIEAGVKIFNEMATFSSAGISE